MTYAQSRKGGNSPGAGSIPTVTAVVAALLRGFTFQFRHCVRSPNTSRLEREFSGAAAAGLPLLLHPPADAGFYLNQSGED